MTLEQLRIFIAVAEREHVTRAAEALNLTQSATSSAIAALEERHATRLFERVGRGIRLTESGRVLLPEARAVLARAAAAERTLQDVSDLSRGSLCIAASQTLASYWLPQLMVKFRALYPRIALELKVGNSEQSALEVSELRADLGFIESGSPVDGLNDDPVGSDQMYLVVAPEHPWARRAPTKDEMVRGNWIVRERGSGTRSHMDEILKEMGIDLLAQSDVLELPSNEAIRCAVAAGGGATLLSQLVVGQDVKSCKLIRLGSPDVRRQFRLLSHPERYVTHAAKAFRELLEAGSTQHMGRLVDF